ncbi:orf 11; similar to Raji LF2 [Ateline gammaherpesvirus 3]|uniref:Similar to Raji LF2 n=1 Tax=Ateline herpesvirus 3 TaxID=85618 RepID=Q9YTQ2_ATHV3|nr:orf 11; similar to Raji LF2 [Ateline gammaherpesvirus 3]AAC95535.1 orf 11; similar to Raji LF2 [Ateline gammaherpesvirus 3]
MATPKHIRGVWRRGSAMKQSERKFNYLFWSSSVHEHFITITNNQEIQILPDDVLLARCPSIREIVGKQLPNFKFSGSRYGPPGTITSFYVYGHCENVIKIKPMTISDCDQELIFKITFALECIIPPGSMKIFILPITFLKLDGLYLLCLEDETSSIMTTSCMQMGTYLTSETPQVFLKGSPVLTKNEPLPHLMAQKTKPFNKKMARVHTVQNEVCEVNSIYKGKDHIRLALQKKSEDVNFFEPVIIGLTMTNKALIAFQHNPYYFCPWDWGRQSIPIIYVGPSIRIPADRHAVVKYNNMYSSTYANITAMITNCETCPDFHISDCEWKPESPVYINVTNTLNIAITISSGTKLGEAVFLLAPKFLCKKIISKKHVQTLPSAVTLPGNVTINSNKLPKLADLTTYK